MKQLKFILLAVSLFTATIITAQEIPRRVFNAGGGQADAANVALSWSIGQAGLAGTLSHATVELNTGFQQFDNLLVSTDEILTEIHYTVFPNPFRDRIFLDIASGNFTEINIRLFDNYGRLLSEKNFTVQTNDFRQTVKTEKLPPGMYNLQITSVDKTNKITTHSLKLIKH